MSRSNPAEHSPNPSQRWFEWNGETGSVRYFDRTTKENVEVGIPFGFILLDELATVKGWHDPSQSGIFANEVRDTRKEPFTVKSFKGGPIAEGLYRDIKDRVANAGGQFVANCYIAFKDDVGVLTIGSIQFKGAALGAWSEFRKANRNGLYTKAVEIVSYTEGKKGKVVFRVPEFRLVETSQASNTAAAALDKDLQVFLTGYFNRSPQTANPTPPPSAPAAYSAATEVDPDDVPF